MYRAYPSPPLSENQAICLPSGDQTGRRSAASQLCVRFRGLPFSTGTVKISPRASISRRFPVGDNDASAIILVTFSQCGSAQGKSPCTSIVSCVLLPLAGSSEYRYPPRSYTSADPYPVSHLISPSVPCVTCRSPLAALQVQTFS